jgi:hypothetical protein
LENGKEKKNQKQNKNTQKGKKTNKKKSLYKERKHKCSHLKLLYRNLMEGKALKINKKS